MVPASAPHARVDRVRRDDCQGLAQILEARGQTNIAQVAAQLWDARPYLADPRRVLQVRDTALVLAGSAINVVRRADGSWRCAISLLDLDKPTRPSPAPSTTPPRGPTTAWIHPA